MSIRAIRPTLGLLLVPLLAACPAEREGTEAARMDTTSPSWEDGLSAQQVESEARALSPEEAEAQGLTVDTTIHLELPRDQDTVLLPRGNEPTPAPVDPGASDTLRPPGR
jgi:hypothetical protein